MKWPSQYIVCSALLISIAIAIGLWCWLPYTENDDGEPNRIDRDQAASDVSDASDQPDMIRILALRKHLLSMPEDSVARFELAMKLLSLDKQMALQEFQLIPKESPQYLETQKRMAAIFIMSQQTSEAESILKRLHVDYPDDFAVELSLAELYTDQRFFQEALPHIVKSIELKPDRIESYLLHAWALEELGRFDEMREPLEIAIRIEPMHYYAHSLLGFAYLQSGQIELAYEHVSWCLRTDGKNGFVQETAAAVERERGNLDKAFEYAKSAMKLSPERLDPPLIAADILMYRKKPEEAYELLKDRYEAGENAIRFLGAFARAASGCGHRSEAKNAFEKIEHIYLQKMENRRENE
ncbi:MAG TPA: hypothetical protein DD473_03400 [Planctomycetaceae bacterium]|nr:hypothetical protein [Planctomycetaceae bacterium]